ncbi:MAG: ABC transporter substrate-binding protein [Proteobacteria bacterium]|nr:ABC transporter substrate-binding protein [Pseudomonadota bacterium]MBU1387543.1 ABC transporter substrate-binding protein [Pseudomonadota bacterium]MBU1544018.1 ABC transporter substrate-binding protein [Pseudomonadota bacterium]MBU2429140.1 ABC transporter substrate-binding protein [Pseudomonadota bacterium]MBU2479740.1 ABC transporter substrate-binding protein [Pseudomonadota bacterium]
MKKYLVYILTVMTMVVFGLALNATAEEGVTDTEIHIGQWGPQTGPAAPWGAVARGTDAYFKMINADGGIHGRKLIHHYFDDAYNPAKTKAGVKQLQEDTGMFAWVSGVGTAPGLAVKDYLMERKILWVGPSAGSRHWLEPANKYLFNTYPLYLGDAELLTKYAVETLKLKKIAVVYQNDDYGKQGLEGCEAELKKQGLELAIGLPMNVADVDMKPHIMKLKNSDAQAVLLFVGPGHVARLQGTGKAMQFEPQWMTSTTCGDHPLMMAITKGLYAGTISAAFGLMDPTNIGDIADFNKPTLPAMVKFYNDGYKKFAAKEERWGSTFAAGMGYVEPLIEALKRVGRDVTREKVVAELEKIQNFKSAMGTVSYTAFDANDPLCRIGQQEVFLVRAEPDGTSTILTNWYKTTYIPSGH